MIIGGCHGKSRMAPNSNADELDPYELLELPIECTEQEIRTAYRQRSLKVHPDRVRTRNPLLTWYTLNC
jgi:DnaJ-class molecular chaperone